MMPAGWERGDDREQRLDGILEGLGSVLVAFSGGVDSAYLAVRAHHVLGPGALAVTADSESLAAPQREMALSLAREFGFPHRMIRTLELDDPLYVENSPARCFRCKRELFSRLVPLAREEGLAHVAYGLIADDLSDFRPGRRAAEEAGVRSPLADAGLAKEDIRELSRRMGLSTWNEPSSPCLSSRIPYGTPVTSEALRTVERAEAGVRALGFREFRVRHLGASARIELAPEEMGRLGLPGVREALLRAAAFAGYEGAQIDPEGYRRGRLNEKVPLPPTP